MKTSSVAILIVNYNSTAVLTRCLECIEQQKTIFPDVYILDNSDGDYLPQDFYHRFPSVHFSKSMNNIGFAAGNNQLFHKAAGYKWIALVNPDTCLEPDWLQKMLSSAKNYPEYSFFASRLMQCGQQDVVDGDADILHVSGLAWRKNHGISSARSSDEPTEIFSPCAAAALYRRAAIESVGGFDEDYFCYFEDVDLGFRLRLVGNRCLFVPDAIAYHVGSASAGGKQSDFVVYHGHRNLVWTYIKNMPGPLFWLFLPLHIILNIIAVIWFGIHGQGSIIFKSKYDALRGIPRMWRKRHEIQKKRKTSTWEIWKVLDKSILPRLSEKLGRRL